MAASIKCHACSTGDCEHHIAGQTRDGVMGGWLCPCTHSAEEREAARERWQDHVQSLLGPMADPGDMMDEDCLGCRGGSIHHACGRTPDAREVDGAGLTESEASLLAFRLIVQQAENAEDWLLWENLPMLAEGSFEALSGWVEVVARRLGRDLRERERDSGIDTAALLERIR